VLLDGTVMVTVDGEVVDRLAAPSSFGEIALLHDEPRAATVDAATRCELAVIARRPFLDALRRSVTGHRTALAVAARHRRDPAALPPENAND
jgi:CRP-like cAMP-binding protein